MKAPYNKALQLTVKSVAIFAKQKYAPLSPAAELGRYSLSTQVENILIPRFFYFQESDNGQVKFP